MLANFRSLLRRATFFFPFQKLRTNFCNSFTSDRMSAPSRSPPAADILLLDQLHQTHWLTQFATASFAPISNASLALKASWRISISSRGPAALSQEHTSHHYSDEYAPWHSCEKEGYKFYVQMGSGAQGHGLTTSCLSCPHTFPSISPIFLPFSPISPHFPPIFPHFPPFFLGRFHQCTPSP